MISDCLACGGTTGEPFFSIPDLPLVDSFCVSQGLARNVATHSIIVVQCTVCFTVQIQSPPDTAKIYEEYIYESASSPDLEMHFSEYADFAVKLLGEKLDSVLEIGANDGLLLKKLIDRGCTGIVAVDPSPQTALIDLSAVKIINDFFSENVARELEPRRFKLVIANNCFAHISNLKSILQSCSRLLSASGVLIVEVQSTLDLLKSAMFDYIYHEHYFYHSVTSFERLARMGGLELFDVSHVETKGGSYRLQFGHPGQHTRQPSIDFWKYREQVSQVHDRIAWVALDTYLHAVRAVVQSTLRNASGRIVGYGACATGTVLLSYLGIEADVDVLVDDNEKRIGRFSPRTAKAVLSSDQIRDDDMVIVLAWRHAHRIISRLEKRRCAVFVPLPFPRLILSKHN